MRNIYLILLGLLLIILAACSREQATETTHPPQFSGVTIPANYRDEFVLYTTVERSDGTVRDFYINPESVNDFRVGRVLPNDTTIIVEAFDGAVDANREYLLDDNKRLIKGEPLDMVHVIQKRKDWQDADFVSSARADDWNFGSFTFGTTEPFDESISACFHCHTPRQNNDFLYTYTLLNRYKSSDEPQYFFCDLPDRLAC